MLIAMMSRNKRLARLTAKATNVVNSERFHESLCQIPNFDMSNDSDGEVSGSEVSEMIKRYPRSILVKTYRSWSPWSRVCGYFDPRKGINVIHINLWMVRKRNDSSVFETIMHEAIHAVDYIFKDSSFGHGNNSPIGKSSTAPWAISRLATEFFDSY